MSKHPTSYLSPRDIACIEYGRRLDVALWCFGERDELCSRYEVADAIKEARAARERIFRECSDCVHGEDWASFCLCSNKEICYGGKISHEKACTCEHYEERREK